MNTRKVLRSPWDTDIVLPLNRNLPFLPIESYCWVSILAREGACVCSGRILQFAIAAQRAICGSMTPEEFIALRKQLGWSLATLSRHIGITASRLADYETGHTRGKNKKPASIPRVVELACKWLDHAHRPITPAERAARWRDFLAGMPRIDHVVDDRREAIYEPDRGP